MERENASDCCSLGILGRGEGFNFLNSYFFSVSLGWGVGFHFFFNSYFLLLPACVLHST